MQINGEGSEYVINVVRKAEFPCSSQDNVS